jgi:signal transduction histidine kinase
MDGQKGSFDVTLAAALLAACEIELFVNIHRHGLRSGASSYVDAALLVGVMLPIIARRRAAVIVTVTSFASLFALSEAYPAFDNLVVPQLVLFVLPYAVAAYHTKLRPAAGLALCVGLVLVVGFGATSDHSGLWFVVAACSTSWAFGRFVRSHRVLTNRLHETSQQIVAEREGRTRLVIADQRSRIARELEAVVADHVSTMIVQARAAQQLLEDGLGPADDAMATIEETGRETMNDLRRLLGVLRRADGHVEMAPQPGVGQIATLVERRRASGQPIGLRVEGDPAALPASVDLAVYRIVEDVLISAAEEPVDITVRFRATEIELDAVAHDRVAAGWPTVATRERVRLCEGRVDATTEGETTLLVARLPRVLEGAFQ